MPRTPEWRGRCTAALAALLVACADGYPSEDVPAFDPEGMSQRERLAHLGTIGHPRNAAVRWRYELDPACRLSVERKSRWQAAERTRVPLAGADVTLRNDAEGGTFEVVARMHDSTAVTVYAGQRRVDAMHAATLVRLLQRDCTAQLPVDV